MSKYDPFRNYLSGRNADEQELPLSFARLEEILGDKLPATARIDRPWWANTMRSNHARSWLTVGWKVSKVDFGQGIIHFVRLQGIDVPAPAVRASQDGGYRHFKEFLSNLPAEQRQLSLSFQDIEEIIRKKLPAISLVDRPWWANTKSSPQGTSWTAAGWQVEQVFLKAQIIIFRRRSDNLMKSIPRYVRNLLENTAATGRPDNRTLINWISFCRKVGWYFEGTVLFERGGLSLAGLDATETVEAEEHYDVCKRELTRYRR